MNNDANFTPYPLLKKRGMLHVSQSGLSTIQDLSSALDRIGQEYIIHEADELKDKYPYLASGYQSMALYERDVYDIDVALLHQSYLHALKANGGRIETKSSVVSLIFSKGQWSVETDGNSYQAPIVINAAGAWVDDIAIMASLSPVNIQPLKRTIIMTDQYGNMDDTPIIMEADQGCYFKPDNGQWLICAGDATLSPPCDAQPEEIQIAQAASYYQQMTGDVVHKINHKWAGLRSYSLDGYPVVGFDPEAQGFFWLAGQGGYGIKTSPALGQICKSMIIDQSWPDRLSSLGLGQDKLSILRYKGHVAG